MLGLMYEFWHDTIMFERIALPSKPSYNLQHYWVAYVQWGLQVDIEWLTFVSIKAGNTVEASISRSGIGSKGNMREYQ